MSLIRTVDTPQDPYLRLTLGCKQKQERLQEVLRLRLLGSVELLSCRCISINF
jgi:hypothetical protein